VQALGSVAEQVAMLVNRAALDGQIITLERDEGSF